MGLHTWHAQVYVGSDLRCMSGVNNLPESPDRSRQYPADVLFSEIVREAADKEYGAGAWSVARQFDPYAWNAYPAADRGSRNF